MALSVKVRLTAFTSRPSWVDSLAMLFSPLTRRLMLAFSYVKARFSFSLFERSLLEEGPDELRGVEWLEVFHLFSDTDIPYGNAQLLLNANDYASLRGAIEFGEYDAADFRCFLENAGLLKTVLPGRSI